MTDKELCERYPFLIPCDWEGDIPEDYDYSYSWLDQMPAGWRTAFGEQMCTDIMKIIEEDAVDDFQILQIKEKFGELRLYYAPFSQKIEDIIQKYVEMSRKTCIRCGAPAIWESQGWIDYYCDKCAKQVFGNYPKNLIPIREENEG